jgi:hypothetical protein
MATDLTVAATILHQLGGRFFLRMTGAKQMVGSERSLTMTISGRHNGAPVNRVTVRLDPSDTYTVEAAYQRALSRRVLAAEEGIYCDQLQETFTRLTGLYTRL